MANQHHDYPELTAGLTRAFRALRKEGYTAKRHFWCCGSCAWAALSKEEAEKAILIHKQGEENVKEYGEVYVQWAGDGEQIVAALKGAGLVCEWDGTKEQCIKATVPQSVKRDVINIERR